MEAVVSARFIMGIIVGAILYHLWMMRMAKKNG